MRYLKSKIEKSNEATKTCNKVDHYTLETYQEVFFSIVPLSVVEEPVAIDYISPIITHSVNFK